MKTVNGLYLYEDFLLQAALAAVWGGDCNWKGGLLHASNVI